MSTPCHFYSIPPFTLNYLKGQYSLFQYEILEKLVTFIVDFQNRLLPMSSVNRKHRILKSPVSPVFHTVVTVILTLISTLIQIEDPDPYLLQTGDRHRRARGPVHIISITLISYYLFRHRIFILVLTYAAYVCYHASRKPISVVKNELINCTTEINSTDPDAICTSWISMIFVQV